jgi:hypothetical protein
MLMADYYVTGVRDRKVDLTGETKIPNPKSKIQNPRSKIPNPKSQIKTLSLILATPHPMNKILFFCLLSAIALVPSDLVAQSEMNSIWKRQTQKQIADFQEAMANSSVLTPKTLTAAKKTFKITLKDDSVISFKSQVFADSIHFLQFVYRKDTVRLYPADTKKLSMYDPEIGATLNGIPVDTCWLFKSSVGTRVNFYSNIPDFGTQNVIAFQEGSGLIQALTRKNVELFFARRGTKEMKDLARQGQLMQALVQYNN